MGMGRIGEKGARMYLFKTHYILAWNSQPIKLKVAATEIANY